MTSSAPIDIPLEGKIILITGGASGIGLELTKQSHALGSRGILVADLRTTPDFDKFREGKSNIVFVKADVTRWSDFNKMFEVCEKTWDNVPDAYGICAGVFEPPFSNFWLDTEEESYKQVEINVSHPVKLTRMAFRKSLGRGKRATVCIIASIAGLGGNLAVPLYCATKHAVVGFVKSFKDVESLTGVKVTALCPGIVDTPLFTDSKRDQFSLGHQTVLMPDVVAHHMVDLLQKKDYVSGTVLELTTDGPRVIPDTYTASAEAAGARQKDVRIPQQDLYRNMLAPVMKKLESEKNTST